MGLFSKSEPELEKTLPHPLPVPAQLSTAQPVPSDVDSSDPLAVGIFYHENDNLPVALYYFSVSAARAHPIGMVLYAISLRHGWGIDKTPDLEREAVRLLVLATTLATEQDLGDYTRSLDRTNKHATQLVLAMHELGISFKQGWGVPKDKMRAAYYLNMAASLGDPDSQVELGHCYLRGDGVKVNKKMAAFWFRKAEKQGARMVQMQWIWKEKYD
ncbi:hypothetical protein EDD86DRAFT_61836 [Gorgonomyces haynaldii]|nr:hypothetical protein EDD86DRAFT_61836 [Gorgonomyces haynaldii]